ncbi:MAG: hypothetical protein PVH52_01090 [bacterium]|jgi:hypothetical protein
MMQKAMAISVLAAAVIVSACSSGKSTGPENRCAGRSTPDDLLCTLACAHNEREFDAYAGLLHEDFIFVLVPEVAESLSLPAEEPWWGKASDIAATKALFEDETVTDIWFSYELAVDWFACEDVRTDTTFTGICCRLDPFIGVTVKDVRADSTYVDTTYRVDNSWLDITLVRDTHAEDLWVVLRMQEYLKQPKAGAPPAAFATRPSSLSAIKALWKPD